MVTMDNKAMSLQKQKRWTSRPYLNWVSKLPCAACCLHDETIVAHHLTSRHSPWCGGMSYKASDIFVMPLCHTCHSAAHNGDADILDWQFTFIFDTLDKATRAGVLEVDNMKSKFPPDDGIVM
jgi:hypothetical protein